MLNAELYNKAADMIGRGWTQKVYARDERGYSVPPSELVAKSWCLLGAISVVAMSWGPKYYSSTFGKLVENLELNGTVNKWNDHPDRTQGEVVALLREAAARSS